MESQQTAIFPEKRKIPVGVWIVSVIFFLTAISSLLSILTIFFSDTSVGFAGGLFLLYTIVLAVAYSVVGVALLELKNWARIGGIVLGIINAVSAITATVESLSSYPIYPSVSFYVIRLIIYLAISGSIVWYLIRTKNIFKMNVQS